MASTELRSECPSCKEQNKDTKGNNLSWFYNDSGALISRCMANCGYKHPNNDRQTQSPSISDQAPITDNNTADLLTTGHYESLLDRGISETTCRKHHYQVSTLHGKAVHIANYLDKDGKIVSQKVRFLEDKKFIWRGNNESKTLFGQQGLSKEIKTVYISEGEIDCLTLLQLGFPTVSISTGAGDQTVGEIKKHLGFLESFDRVILCFDADKVGQDTAREVAAVFTPGKAYIVPLGHFKDPNEYLKAGKENLLREDLALAKMYVPECIVTPDLEDLLIEDKPRTKLPYPQLQEYVRGISQDDGELWLLAAGPKSGKSTFTKELLKGLLDADETFKAAVCYTEESLKKSGQSFIAIDNNVPLQMYKEDNSLIPRLAATKSYNKYLKNQRVKFVDIHKLRLDSMKIINVLKHLIVGGGYKFIVLDHITMFTYEMDSKNGERKDVDIFMNRLNTLIREYPCTVLAVCHLARAPMGKDWSEGREIHMSDIRSSGIFEQICDVMLALERNMCDDYEKTKAKLKVLANRITGESGYVDELYHDKSTGRLITIDKLFK